MSDTSEKIFITSEFSVPERGLKSCAISSRPPLSDYDAYLIDGEILEPVVMYAPLGIGFYYTGNKSFLGKEVEFVRR